MEDGEGARNFHYIAKRGVVLMSTPESIAHDVFRDANFDAAIEEGDVQACDDCGYYVLDEDMVYLKVSKFCSDCAPYHCIDCGELLSEVGALCTNCKYEVFEAMWEEIHDGGER